MKGFALYVFFALSVALDIRDRGPVQFIRSLNEPPVKFSTDELMTEIKRRISDCRAADGPLAKYSMDELLADLKRREGEKVCKAPAAPPPAPALNATAPAPAVTNTMTVLTTTTTGPDNFADELVDQANVEFKMLDKDKDGCISPSEMTRTLRHQVEVARSRDYYWQLRAIAKGKKDIAKDMSMEHDQADIDEDGCVDKEEFDDLRHAIDDCPAQFALMDHNGDGKISRQEAATYVSDHMIHADLSYGKFVAIFNAADIDGSTFLSKQEFCEAGPRYQGDGDCERGPCPGPLPGPSPAPVR